MMPSAAYARADSMSVSARDAASMRRCECACDSSARYGERTMMSVPRARKACARYDATIDAARLAAIGYAFAMLTTKISSRHATP